MTGAAVGKGIVDWKAVRAAIPKTRVTAAYLELEAPYRPSAMALVRDSYAKLHGHI